MSVIGKACRAARCPTIHMNLRPYCDAHMPPEEPKWSRRKKAKDPFYDSKEWKQIRAKKIKANPVCEVCNDAPTQQVDHVIPMFKNPALKLSYDNLQSQCRSCHAKKSQKESREYIRNKRKREGIEGGS